MSALDVLHVAVGLLALAVGVRTVMTRERRAHRSSRLPPRGWATFGLFLCALGCLQLVEAFT